MKRIVSLLCLIFVLVFSFGSAAFASSNLSVPLSSDAYRIIRTAEIRGIIPLQPDVKPYSVSLVRDLLERIVSSDQISAIERKSILDTLDGLDSYFEEKKNRTLSDALRTNGRLNLFDNGSSSFDIGVRISSMQSVGCPGFSSDMFSFDSRNKGVGYLAGNLSDNISYYMDFGVLMDRIDHRSFLYTDFQNECEGFYLDLLHGGVSPDSSPFDSFYMGFAMRPEISASLLGNTLSIRFGAVERDWGPALNNLVLSASACSMDAIEFTYSPSSAFSFSSLVGSTGKGFLALSGESAPIGGTELHSNRMDNNFSAQRIEISPASGIRFSIYESVIWRKRFELAYLNPLCIYMFAQNYIGDFDNMMAGMDFSILLGSWGRAYAALSMDEMNSANPKKIFTSARNIVALQGGLDISLPVFNFSELTLQVTYLPPFFGTHYVFRSDVNPFCTTDMAIDYANKGKTLSYPMFPDSLEVLVSFSTTLDCGLGIDFTVKDQMRSAQYSTNDETGTGFDTTMNYEVSSDFRDKDFFSFVWRNTLDAKVQVRKELRGLPVSLVAGVEVIVDSKRPYHAETKLFPAYDNTYETKVNYNPETGLIGDGTSFTGPWSASVSIIGRIGFEIYY